MKMYHAANIENLSLRQVRRNEKLQRIFYMYICCICYWFYLRRNDVQIIKQVSRNEILVYVKRKTMRICKTKWTVHDNGMY
mgnify:CR=1 FL=1